jgi:hypothetical protein
VLLTAEDVGGSAPDALTIPTWVPEPVAQAARILHAHHVKSIDAKYNAGLERLIGDERMRSVWNELSKRRREQYQKTDVFLHSANLLWIDSEAPQDHQGAAMASLLYVSVNLTVNNPRVITRKELEKLRSGMLDKVAALRTAANEIRRYGPSRAAAAKVNEDIARGQEELLPKMEASTLVVDRDTGDAQSRGFCILFSKYCRQLFGSPLYRITAIVASVALEREITSWAVREWCNPSLADKRR